MPLSSPEATQMLETYYPTPLSNIHGRLYASRITTFIPKLVDFFKQNKELVPAKFQNELDSLSSSDLENWQRVAMLRASGRNTSKGFEDKDSGSKFAAGGKTICERYLQQSGLLAEKAGMLAQAIVEADPLNPLDKPATLLGWMLKHAALLETLRDQRNQVEVHGQRGVMKDKTVSIKQLPSWDQAKNSPELADKLKALAKTHYELIVQQQGFACVGLTDEKGNKFYPAQIDLEGRARVKAGQQIIRQAGLNAKNCFDTTSRLVDTAYQSYSLGPTKTPPPKTAPRLIVPPLKLPLRGDMPRAEDDSPRSSLRDTSIFPSRYGTAKPSSAPPVASSPSVKAEGLTADKFGDIQKFFNDNYQQENCTCKPSEDKNNLRVELNLPDVPKIILDYKPGEITSNSFGEEAVRAMLGSLKQAGVTKIDISDLSKEQADEFKLHENKILAEEEFKEWKPTITRVEPPSAEQPAPAAESAAPAEPAAAEESTSAAEPELAPSESDSESPSESSTPRSGPSM